MTGGLEPSSPDSNSGSPIIFTLNIIVIRGLTRIALIGSSERALGDTGEIPLIDCTRGYVGRIAHTYI